MDNAHAPHNDASHPAFGREKILVEKRRRVVYGQTETDDKPLWGLAFSGGGIRSATFALGVAQAMAKARLKEGALWSRFDYLSTVSGGGYIGGFLTSLFIPGRLKADTDASQAADLALSALAHDPPGRSDGRHHPQNQRPMDRPLSWLRENGRYLAPEGTGDYFFAVAVGLRNFLAVQYVLATALFSLALVSQTLRAGLIWAKGLLCNSSTTPILLGLMSTWVVVGFVLLLGLAAPLGMAYWMTQPTHRYTLNGSPRAVSTASMVYLVVGGMLASVAYRLNQPSSYIFACVLAIISAWCFVAFAIHGVAVLLEKNRGGTVLSLRSRITLWYVNIMRWVLWVLALGALESLAQWLYAKSMGTDGIMTGAFWSVALSSGLVWLVNVVSGAKDTGKVGSLAKKLPAKWLVNGLAAAVAVALVTGWLLMAVIVRHQVGNASLIAGLTCLVLMLTFFTGQFPGFVNLSSWHAFYSSRLRRAYLGATNKFRQGAQVTGVTDTVKDDEPKPAAYWGMGPGRETGAPLHLINVCVSKTTGSGGNLTQRDRRGENLCVGPVAYQLGNRVSLRREKNTEDKLDATETRTKGMRQRLWEWLSPDVSPTLQVSEWIGVSGAAVSSGMGRATSLGGAMLVGIANVRLGRWWPHPFNEKTAKVAAKQTSASAGRPPSVLDGVSAVLKSMFKTQSYLFYELTAKFFGTDKDWVYLSDGGNFENTAAYELLRPERGLRFVVVCDSGCDPDYRFEDLANLVRLARIDHGLELTLDANALQNPEMSKWLATPQTLGRGQGAGYGGSPPHDNRCAMLFKVTDPKQGKTVAHLLLIKPSVIAACTVDVQQYHAANPSFPQQTTSDQSFNEEQWESYRKLGLTVGEQLFGDANISSKFLSALMTHIEAE